MLFGESNDTIIGPGTVIQGSMELQHGIQVLGSLHGARLKTRGKLIVEPEGEVRCGWVHVDGAVIRGHLVGSLSSTGPVRITASGCFQGSLTAPQLVLEEGARLIVEPQLVHSALGGSDSKACGVDPIDVA